MAIYLQKGMFVRALCGVIESKIFSQFLDPKQSSNVFGWKWSFHVSTDVRYRFKWQITLGFPNSLSQFSSSIYLLLSSILSSNFTNYFCYALFVLVHSACYTSPFVLCFSNREILRVSGYQTRLFKRSTWFKAELGSHGTLLQRPRAGCSKGG